MATVGVSNTINLALELDNTLDEVVVTALGIKREEKALGYATQNLTSESLTTVRDGNIVNALSGKIAGVSITNSSGTTIVHDGYTTDSSSGLQAVATLDVVGGYNYTITPL